MSRLDDMIRRTEERLNKRFQEIEKIEELRTRQVLDIFREAGVSYRHFSPTTGYGYDDIGRDTLEKVFAGLFHTEAALMRPQIASGTAALSLSLFGLTHPGERILSITGLPYDTLIGILGIGKTPGAGSLKEYGVDFDCVELKDGQIDLSAVRGAMTPKTSLVIAQRSRGYAWRRSLMPEDFEAVSAMLHTEFPGVLFMVDNCYGEFVREKEPTDFGADVCVGSMIKNPGGGIAPTGGYIAGSAEAVDRIAWRLTAPGLGRELGSYAGSYRPYYQGLFMAPHTVAQALKTAHLAAGLAEEIGLSATPAAEEIRADIIQAIRMETPEGLVAFCQGLQAASPVDSMALPEPWDMPGYEDQVVMAAGTFVAGASIELSADGPMRPPYTAYMQGGLTYAHGRIALKEAMERVLRGGSGKSIKIDKA